MVDYLWEYKVLSILHSMISLGVAVLVLLKYKKGVFTPCSTDGVILFLFFLISFSFLRNYSEYGVFEFLKFLSYVSFYFVGRFISSGLRQIKILGLFSLVSLVYLTVLAAIGKGYAVWGGISTFTGGYYFKTDLAIAALILLTFSFVSINRRSLLVVAFLCAGFLVFKSNARIALPLLIVIPVFTVMVLRGVIAKVNIKAISVALIAMLAGMTLFAFIDFEGLGMLGFDFSDPFSAANTQGRSVIWAALLRAYFEAGLVGKLTGLGLDADLMAAALFSESIHLESVRAHNSYLYLLVCVGLLGSFSFYWLIYSIFSKVPYLLKYGAQKGREIPALSCSFLLLFLWLSMTTEIIIRPQLMILFFFFSGVLVQEYLKVKKNIRKAERAATSRA
ncbi:hypothetical protein [Stutzerimonas nitrititolerans]|uniref:hypothetical protein n=1 Tax=Stutzerimonas nitrititolerans TaxID=2482751 RepID=UPI0028A9BB95|nr:hypothetical protein [Stutzerimonas nitrititolerans]